MYTKHYGFSEQPFNMTPNPRFFYESSKHTEALSTLVYAIEQRKGFVVITGDIGSGKTTVCRSLLNHLNAYTEVALITNSHISGKDLLVTILEDLEVEFKMGSKARLLSQLNDYLIMQLRNNNNVVLIIDEAQNLSASVLEEVRMLSNLETESEKLIQIVFLGQLELHSKILKIANFFDRISFKYTLNPLSREETKEMIEFRIRKAGYSSNMHLFLDEATNEIYKATKGYPRRIIMLCHRVLKDLILKNRVVVDANMVTALINQDVRSGWYRQDALTKEEV
ncbi:MAG: AAA family ATPase [Candidatus Heimdallarchaeota archaeon]|nr:AAA family ATPase [Candidatus Heimdallarchaeota archaeon]